MGRDARSVTRSGPGAVLARIIWTIPLTIVFTYFYIWSRGDLRAPLLLHTSINLLADLGFARFEMALMLFFFLISAVATVMALTGPMRKKWAANRL